MDSDATILQNAVDVLHRHYGERLSGPQQSAEAQMCDTLQQEMGLDAASADRVLKKLGAIGRLAYVGRADDGSVAGMGETGPVISMPLTQSSDGGTPLVTAVSPALLMGIVDEPDAHVSQIVESDEEAAPWPSTARGDEEGEAGSTQGYWRIG